MDLTVDIGGGLRLRNPVLMASGTFGHGAEYQGLFDFAHIGGVVTKTITRHPRAGNPPPRTAETPSGMLNSIGLTNPGLEGFIAEKLPGWVPTKYPEWLPPMGVMSCIATAVTGLGTYYA